MAAIVTPSVPPLMIVWLPETVICGPPFDPGAAPDIRTPCVPPVVADAAMSSTSSAPAGDGEIGDSVESLLQASVIEMTLRTTAKTGKDRKLRNIWRLPRLAVCDRAQVRCPGLEGGFLSELHSLARTALTQFARGLGFVIGATGAEGQSVRSAVTGSIEAIRLAGRRPAARATVTRVTTDTVNVSTSNRPTQ